MFIVTEYAALSEVDAFLQELQIGNQKCDAAGDKAAGVMIPMCHHCFAGDTKALGPGWIELTAPESEIRLITGCAMGTRS